MNKELLQKCLPKATPANIEKYSDKLIRAMAFFEINTPKRQAAFLAQIAHESGSLKYVEEIASGDAYDTRTDLGNTKEVDGDGRLYKGRGLIQITGKTNYTQVGKALNYDFIKNPEDLELPGPAAFSAAWFWKSRGLNELADRGDFVTITRRINGGLNGQTIRVKYWNITKEALNV